MRPGRWVRRAALGALVVGSLVLGAGATPLAGDRPAAAASGPTVTLAWAHLMAPGTAIAESSPVEATLDGAGPSVVVGTRMGGCVVALQLADGSTTPGWDHVCPGMGIDSTPAVVRSASGTDDLVVTMGDVTGLDPPAAFAGLGGIMSLAPDGQQRWYRTLPDVYGVYGAAPPVPASPVVGDPGTGQPAIVVGTVGLSLYALDPATGATLPGWPQRTADTTFASAAIADIGGSQGIIAASDSTAGPGALDDWDGGAVRRMTGGGQTLWTQPTNEVVSSGVVVGDLDGSGPVAVYGHGHFWGGSDQDVLSAVEAATGRPLWGVHLGGYTLATPALADLLGNGQLDVVEPTWRGVGRPTGGEVTAVDPQGRLLWRFFPPTSTTITGSVATADLGDGHQDVVVATGTGWYLLDGRTGVPMVPPQGIGLPSFAGDPHPGNLDMQDAPLVVPDPSGNGLDLVLAGTYFAGGGDITRGFVAAYHLQGPGVPNGVGAGAWPQFRGNPQLTGSTIPPAPPVGTCPHDAAPCPAEGYLEAGSDGGLFSYGRAAYRGSVPAAGVAVGDVVGIAATADGGGYWEVGADGGIFSFGDAAFRGSMGGRALAAPVVGMAADPATGGYWEVGADGGVYAFGAPFYGSMGGRVLGAPIVGMAATPDGHGYWLVGADGGVDAFGDAAFRGSMGGRALAAPVVGMVADPATGGYWEVGADGGVYAFGAPFLGSMGGHRLGAPMVGMAATGTGAGYWEVGADGGVFSFGDAYFRGSAAAMALTHPVVGMAAVG